VLGAEHAVLVVTEKDANRRIVLIKAIFDGGQEGGRRGFGQEPEIA
jgi:hypothetical protein